MNYGRELQNRLSAKLNKIILVDETRTNGILAAEQQINGGHGQQDNLPFSTTFKKIYLCLWYLRMLIKYANSHFNNRIIEQS